MEKWLLKFDKISEDYPDPSDYNIFLTNCVFYLKSNKEQHLQLCDIFQVCLRKFKNVQLILITYRLIGALDCEVLISNDVLRSHLHEFALKDDIFYYLSHYYDKSFEEIMVEHLYDPHLFSTGLYSALNLNLSEEISKFLSVRNVSLIKKQIDLMININRFENIEYFVSFIGSGDKLVCFGVFELLLQMVKVDFNCEFMTIDNGNIRFKERITVESPDNFIFYFIDFIEERNKLIGSYYSHDICDVSSILDRYIISSQSVGFFYKKVFLSDQSRRFGDGPIFYEDLNFDYLFNNIHYKIQSDCIEI